MLADNSLSGTRLMTESQGTAAPFIGILKGGEVSRGGSSRQG